VITITGKHACGHQYQREITAYFTVLIHQTNGIMIKEVSGDLLLSNATAIAHGVAPFDHFDSGLALSLREEYPSMFKDFKHYCKLENPEPGEAWIWSGVGGKRIINLLTQAPAPGHGHGGHPGAATITNVNHALHALKKIIQKEGIKSVAIPRLATGVGGLKWEDVFPLIQQQLGDLSADVYVYSTYSKGKAAEEK
jgi:O-acetyl-ADP-ribose deacetylase (regulator of RNase III)